MRVTFYWHASVSVKIYMMYCRLNQFTPIQLGGQWTIFSWENSIGKLDTLEVKGPIYRPHSEENARLMKTTHTLSSICFGLYEIGSIQSYSEDNEDMDVMRIYHETTSHLFSTSCFDDSSFHFRVKSFFNYHVFCFILSKQNINKQLIKAYTKSKK